MRGRRYARYDRATHLKGQGLAEHRQYWHDVVGYNYRMTNICAAIGLAQLERRDETLQRSANGGWRTSTQKNWKGFRSNFIANRLAWFTTIGWLKTCIVVGHSLSPCEEFIEIGLPFFFKIPCNDGANLVDIRLREPRPARQIDASPANVFGHRMTLEPARRHRHGMDREKHRARFDTRLRQRLPQGVAILQRWNEN